MAHIVTLKDNNDEISYPITPVDAVFADSNTSLSDVLNDKADVDMSNIDTESITADKIDFSTLDFGNFSTSEVDTGMTWVDGKHIYKQVFADNFTTPAVGTRLRIDLIAANVDNVIRVCGNYSPNNSSITTGEHYVFGGGALGSTGPDAEISVRTNSSKLQLLIDNYVNNYAGQTGSYSLSVEYTKIS